MITPKINPEETRKLARNLYTKQQRMTSAKLWTKAQVLLSPVPFLIAWATVN